MSKEYNGWTNYATWRINLEILGDIEFENKMSADDLKEIVEDCVFNNTVEKDCLAADYARAFIQQVNFYEIAQSINEELELQTEYDN
jgi:hypothetical protein